MFETDAAILMNDGKYSSSSWKKVGICFVLIICFVSLYVTLSKFDFEKKLITQTFDDLGNIEIHGRGEWNARPPLKKILTTRPASYVVISHTATSSCSGVIQCCKMILDMQNYQMLERHYDDIGYNFLIGSNQSPIYEGRGWGIQPDDFYNYKNTSFNVALIGNFSNERPNNLQIENLKKLIQYGIDEGKIDKNYTLLGHRQFRPTDSSGQVLFDIIKKWDHWRNI